MKKVKKKSTENCHFYSCEISLYIALEYLRNEHSGLYYPYISILRYVCCKILLYFTFNRNPCVQTAETVPSDLIRVCNVCLGSDN